MLPTTPGTGTPLTNSPLVPSIPIPTPPVGLPELRIGNVTLLYGDTGTFKTTELAQLAVYVYEKTGLPSRYFTADGGGYAHIQAYIDAGFMDVYPLVEDKDLPMLLQIRAIQRGGWLPFHTVNGKRGLTGPDKNGLKDGKVGAMMGEGLTSIASKIIRQLGKSGQKVSQDIVGAFQQDGLLGDVEKFGAPSQSHYGFVQNVILDMIANLATLNVPYVFLTAHEGKGDDSTTKAVIYGPGVEGKAITSKIPWNVADLFHLETTTEGGIRVDPTKPGQPVLAKQITRAYFTKHPDSQLSTILWPAKPRFPLEELDKLTTKYPGGYIELDGKQHVADYFRFRDQLTSASTDTLVKLRQEIEAKRAKEATQP